MLGLILIYVLLKIVLLFFVLYITLIIHEFGHVLFVKLAGLKVDNIIIGTGHKIFSYKKFILNIFPFTGYTVFDKAAFFGLSRIKKSLILLGGVFFNFVFFVIFSCSYLILNIEQNKINNSTNNQVQKVEKKYNCENTFNTKSYFCFIKETHKKNNKKIENKKEYIKCQIKKDLTLSNFLFNLVLISFLVGLMNTLPLNIFGQKTDGYYFYKICLKGERNE